MSTSLGGEQGSISVIREKHALLSDTSDVLLTIAGVALVVGVAFAVLQNRSTSNELRRHADIQAQTSVESCYRQNAEAQILQNLLIAFSRSRNIEPRVLEAVQTYLAELRDNTPRIYECRRLATELEVNK